MLEFEKKKVKKLFFFFFWKTTKKGEPEPSVPGSIREGRENAVEVKEMHQPESGKWPTISESTGDILYLNNSSEKRYILK